MGLTEELDKGIEMINNIVSIDLHIKKTTELLNKINKYLNHENSKNYFRAGQK